MRSYLALLDEVLRTGVRQSNRTGIDAITVPGAMLKFDLAEGFPAVTTKILAFRIMAAELVGFLTVMTTRSTSERSGAGSGINE